MEDTDGHQQRCQQPEHGGEVRLDLEDGEAAEQNHNRQSGAQS